MARSVRKEKVYLHVKCFSAKLSILPNRNLQICVKTTNQNWVPNQTETTSRACLVDKERILTEEKGLKQKRKVAANPFFYKLIGEFKP